MKLRMQEAETPAQLSIGRWDLGIVGRPVDDRGRAAIDLLGRLTDKLTLIEYNSDEYTFEVDGRRINAESLGSELDGLCTRSLILETTTLGFVEIFSCTRYLRSAGTKGVTFLYVEPAGYHSPRRFQPLHKRDFELSGEVPGYKAIPGATIMLTDRVPQRGVFFLGYEARRLDQALEDFQMIRAANCAVVFGVPAFKPGWEMDAFANNIRSIRDKNIRGGVHFCGAENPAAAFDTLSRIYSGRGKERMFVAPIGTKPNGIGVALFVSEHADVGLLYDHPRRRPGRTSKTARWHIFEVEFT